MKLLIIILLLVSSCGYKQKQGDPGPTGATGATGAQGLPGVNGTNGKDAVPCSVSPVSGGALVSCPDGTTSLVTNGVNGVNGLDGINGTDGLNGTNGTNGSNGTNGTNATPITTVQFCPNYTGTYPSDFPEFGICIAGNTYAVYWDGRNAWLAQVYPGAYSSTSSSAPCNFTMLANCQVQ